MTKILKILLVLPLLVGLITSCDDDDNDDIFQEPAPNEINEFIWSGLNTYYLWEDQVSGLELQEGSNSWRTYLNSYGDDHESLFGSLLYNSKDKWSWITDDYIELINSFNGVFESFGYEYGLVYSDAERTKVIAYVRYTIPGSPAAQAGLKRGDVIYAVDGVELTAANYKDLLFDRSSYTISLATYSDNDKLVTPTGEQAFLRAVKLEENPVLMARTLDIGATKVGYLMYNSFTGTDEYNLALNDSIGKLKAEGIEELVLDLRYNGGGYVYTSQLLSSMIAGNHIGKVFYRAEGNRNVSLSEPEGLFVSEILNTEQERKIADINHLHLQRLYVLVSEETASASELLINGLEPYLDEVVLIGERTVGKYVGSTTLYDENEDGIVNSNHTWAMQPIVIQYTNAEGVTEFANGFTPDYELSEYKHIGSMRSLGDPEELLLSKALELIGGGAIVQSGLGISADIDRVLSRPILENTYLASSKANKPFGEGMYDNRLEWHK